LIFLLLLFMKRLFLGLLIMSFPVRLTVLVLLSLWVVFGLLIFVGLGLLGLRVLR